MANLFVQARLSNVVEADPDCKAALDVLSFALYHEETREAPQTDDTKENKRVEVTDDEDEGNDSKRLRLENVEPDVKKRVWDQVVSSDGEDLSVEDLCRDIQDRSVVEAALRELEREDRVMVDDGLVFHTG